MQSLCPSGVYLCNDGVVCPPNTACLAAPLALALPGGYKTCQ